MKILQAILYTVLMLVLSFAYPILFHWYDVTYASQISQHAYMLPTMISFYLWIGLFYIAIRLWVRAFEK